MDEQMREKFEHWYSDASATPKAIERDTKGNYKYMGTHNAWTTWQACAAALSQPAAAEPEIVGWYSPAEMNGFLPAMIRLKRDNSEGCHRKQLPVVLAAEKAAA